MNHDIVVMPPSVKVTTYKESYKMNPRPPVGPGDILVDFVWWNAGVDRLSTGGIICSAEYGPRIKAACDNGVLFRDARIKKDTNGKTYVEATCMVRGRTLDADLKELGY